jgi:hypothetical protein
LRAAQAKVKTDCAHIGLISLLRYVSLRIACDGVGLTQFDTVISLAMKGVLTIETLRVSPSVLAASMSDGYQVVLMVVAVLRIKVRSAKME